MRRPFYHWSDVMLRALVAAGHPRRHAEAAARELNARADEEVEAAVYGAVADGGPWRVVVPEGMC